MKPFRYFRISLSAVFIVYAASLSAFPANSWKHLQSEHFVLSYSERTDELAAQALQIAEDTRTALTSYFGDLLDPRRISIVLHDEGDIPNGGASTTDPVVNIDVRKAPSLFRGETDWLRTVLSHELSHEYSIQVFRPPFQLITAAGFGNFGWMQFWGNLEIPEWFVEGVAQMGSRRVGADAHDAIRQMLLRDAVLNDTLLTIDQMARFEGTGLDYELAYNQGFSLLIYLENAYKDVPLSRLCRIVNVQGFLPAFVTAYKKPLAALYQDWKASLSRTYADVHGEPGRRVGPPRGPMDLEVASGHDGAYVIANWGNDYERMSLFRKTAGGSYRLVSSDTGETLKVDAQGNAWFNKLVYDGTMGAEVYEVFRADKNDVVTQQTWSSRVLAFDVVQGCLVYAKYQHGTTQVISRDPSGAETTLVELGADTGVYSLSALTKETALLTLGEGSGVRLGILAGGKITPLWPDQEILEAVAAPDNRVVFSSTHSGSPQLYWADLAADANTWYQLTEAPGGARFPSTPQAGSALRYSEFARGGYHFCVLNEPFSTAQPVTMSTTVSPPLTAPLSTTPASLFLPAGSNPVVHIDPLYVAVNSYIDALVGSSVNIAFDTALGARGSISDAPGDSGVDFALEAHVPLNTYFAAVPYAYLSLGGNLDTGPLKNNFDYQLQVLNYDGYGFATHLYHLMTLQTQAEIASNQRLGAYYNGYWEQDAVSVPSNIYFGRQTGGLRWVYSDSPTSVFDPAHLGQNGIWAHAGGDVVLPQLLDLRYFNTALFNTQGGVAGRVTGGAGVSSLLFGSRANLSLAVDALAVWGGMLGGKPTLGVLSSVGGGSLLDAYPAGYASVDRGAVGTLSLSTNPFVDTSHRAEWYQRMNLTASLQAGYVDYLAYLSGAFQMLPAYPLALEVSYKSYGYDAPNQQSGWRWTVDLVLNDFVGNDGGTALPVPFQVSGGYSY